MYVYDIWHICHTYLTYIIRKYFKHAKDAENEIEYAYIFILSSI